MNLNKIADHLQQEDEQRYFFGHSDDNFLIPIEKYESWSKLTENDIPDDAYDLQEEFETLFSEHRLGGVIENISFTSPKDIK